MNDSTEVRLENLERELVETKAELCRVRRRNLWFLVSGILMAGLLALAWMFMDFWRPAYAQGDATIYQQIRAKEFALVDERGEIRAVLNMHQRGPKLSLYGEKDEEGNYQTAVLLVDKKMALLALNGRGSAMLGTSTEHGPSLNLVNEKGCKTLKP